MLSHNQFGLLNFSVCFIKYSFCGHR